MTTHISISASLILVACVTLTTAPAQGPGRTRTKRAEIDPAKLPPPSTQEGVTYAKDIRPLFEATCFRCHGDEKQKGDLRLDSLETIMKGSEFGKVINPGDSAKSPLVAAVSGLDEEHAMPPKRRPGGPGGPGEAAGPGGPAGQASPGRPPGPGGARAPRSGGPGAGPSEGAQRNAPAPDRPGERAPGGRGGGGFGGPGPGGGGMAKRLTSEQVGLVRAWIDQGAK